MSPSLLFSLLACLGSSMAAAASLADLYVEDYFEMYPTRENSRLGLTTKLLSSEERRQAFDRYGFQCGEDLYSLPEGLSREWARS